MRKIADLIEDSQLEQQPGRGRRTGGGKLAQKSFEQRINLRMARIITDQLLDQLTTVTGECDRIKVVAQTVMQVEQINFAQS